MIRQLTFGVLESHERAYVDVPRFPYVRPYGKFFDDVFTPLRNSYIVANKGAGIDCSRRTCISSFKSESIGESRRIRAQKSFAIHDERLYLFLSSCTIWNFFLEFFLSFSREDNEYT